MARKRRPVECGKVYCVRDKETGENISDLTKGWRTYYICFACAENAVRNYKRRTANTEQRKLEVVEFRLEEIVSYDI